MGAPAPTLEHIKTDTYKPNVCVCRCRCRSLSLLMGDRQCMLLVARLSRGFLGSFCYRLFSQQRFGRTPTKFSTALERPLVGGVGGFICDSLILFQPHTQAYLPSDRVCVVLYRVRIFHDLLQNVSRVQNTATARQHEA